MDIVRVPPAQAMFPSRSIGSINGVELKHILIFISFLSIVSIFFGISFDAGVKIDLFSIISVISVIPLALNKILRLKLPRSQVFLVIALYFSVTVCSAAGISTENFVREALQALIILSLSFVIFTYTREIRWVYLGKWFFLVSYACCVYSTVWHISNGYYSGFKLLGDMKLAYSYAIIPIIMYLIVLKRQHLALRTLLLGIFVISLILSGQRKSELAFLLSMLVLISFGYIRLYTAIVTIGAILTLVVVVASYDPYVNKQLMDVLSGPSTGQLAWSQLLSPGGDVSPSNIQREFATRVAVQLFWDNPWWGVGTNNFINYVKIQSDNLPAWMMLGVHGEFTRTMVENGAIGLGLYLLPWVRSVAWICTNGRRLPKVYIVFYLVTIIVIFSECAFEGGGSRAFIAFVFMSSLPEITKAAVAQRINAEAAILKPRSNITSHGALT